MKPDFAGLNSAEVAKGAAFMLRAGLPIEQVKQILSDAGIPTTSTKGPALVDEIRDVQVPMIPGAVEAVTQAMGEGRLGFAWGWVSSVHLSKILKGLPPNKQRAFMRTLGYDWHPGLTDGRVNNPAKCDEGKKSRLYVSSGHYSALEKSPSAVVRAYEDAQSSFSVE